MRRFTHAISGLFPATVLSAAWVGGLVVLSMLVFGSPPASALPPASGSNCSSSWVNNGAAMDCFVQGEEDVRNGVSNPHYVACTKAGEVFCCVDKSGGQDCVACEAAVKPPSETVKLGAILEAQRTILMALTRMSTRVDTLESKVGLSAKHAP